MKRSVLLIVLAVAVFCSPAVWAEEAAQTATQELDCQETCYDVCYDAFLECKWGCPPPYEKDDPTEPRTCYDLCILERNACYNAC